jgi:hypothetical protein
MTLRTFRYHLRIGRCPERRLARRSDGFRTSVHPHRDDRVSRPMNGADLWDDLKGTLEAAHRRCTTSSAQVVLYIAELDFTHIEGHLLSVESSTYTDVACLIRPRLSYPIVVTLTTAIGHYYR